MHLVHRLAAVVLTLGLSASLTGCGFHLIGRGPQSTPIAYQHMKLNLPADANVLGDKLTMYLTGNGAKFDNATNAYTLHVLSYDYKRQKLSGRVAEVLLHLNVTFQIEDSQGNAITTPRTITGIKTYQYNVATVNVDDNEEHYLIDVLIDDVAQQMSRQISSNRLPIIQQQQ
ncbi:LPS-assembly lipoprotein LptE [Acinetobacter sp. HY1485]|uniref:LPS-assembly lipoprotein LptE n=1 Tax=Acinetobacter sp. HY1485 TaxID=2970918 RepID=UPI0022B997FC|nr:LPS assembly lipoprotein LptE [Acinetobacter sp. HY1485]